MALNEEGLFINKKGQIVVPEEDTELKIRLFIVVEIVATCEQHWGN
jgi:bifunctional DNA-binding transcriptional regulator/antitoxin component of YhaV-PrlF toxin-antitoxin module